jgi:hypothetical protein
MRRATIAAVGSLRSLFAFGALLVACHPTPRPEGGDQLQIKPDVHNLFRYAAFYVSPSTQQPVALWMDRPEPARTEVAKWIDDAGTGIVVVVVSGLSNRDCSGIDEKRYRAELVESVAASIESRKSHRVVIVLEPKALTNLVAHDASEKCVAADAAIQRSVGYAMGRLAMSGVEIYLDGGDSQLVSTDGDRDKLAGIIKNVCDQGGGADKIRGFAIDVGGSGALALELAYTHSLFVNLVKVGILDKFFVIDTTLKGVPSRVAPGAGIDAYFWISPPAH